MYKKLLIALVLCISMAGCGKKVQPEESSTENTEEKPFEPLPVEENVTIEVEENGGLIIE